MIQRRCGKGFTLVELLVCVAILGYCLSPLLAVTINSVALNDASCNRLIAATHAEVVMESIKNVAFSTIPSNMGGANWGAWTLDSAGVTALGLVPLKNEAITTNLTGTNPIDVAVTVTWMDKGLRSRSFTLRTLITG